MSQREAGGDLAKPGALFAEPGVADVAADRGALAPVPRQREDRRGLRVGHPQRIGAGGQGGGQQHRDLRQPRAGGQRIAQADLAAQRQVLVARDVDAGAVHQNAGVVPDPQLDNLGPADPHQQLTDRLLLELAGLAVGVAGLDLRPAAGDGDRALGEIRPVGDQRVVIRVACARGQGGQNQKQQRPPRRGFARVVWNRARGHTGVCLRYDFDRSKSIFRARRKVNPEHANQHRRRLPEVHRWPGAEAPRRAGSGRSYRLVDERRTRAPSPR